jgi:Protein of unknown function (DUF1631)
MATNFNPLIDDGFSATANVFPFPNINGQHARRQNVKPESVRMINDCRDIALKRITDVLSKTFDTIEDELFEMAEKSIDRSAQNLYLDARAQAREKRGAIAVAFKKQFLSFFEQKMSGDESAKKSTANNVSALELSLVADDDLEEKLAVEAIAKRLTNNCDEELRAVSQRLGFLMSEPELNDEANPISPDTIVKALQIACEQMTSGYQSKLTVMRLVEAGMAKEMMGVYRDINAHLVSRHVLPQIRPTYQRPQTSGSRATPTVTTSSPVAAGAAAAGAATNAPAQSAHDLFATLQQLIAGGNASTAASSTANAGGNLFAQAAGANGIETKNTGSITSTGLISALTDIQQQLMAGRAETAQFAAMLNLQNFVPGETPNASLNFLREIKQQAVATGSNQVDAMTIDIIAMLFDYVFEDKAIPDSVKALLAKLQIPVLKVAIMDKSFFSLKTHPARRLLDLLAEASVCFAGQASKDDPLYQQIEAVVNRIHDEFTTDVTLFATMLTEFEAFLFSRESASADRAEQSARAVHESEKREMARMIAIDETDRRANEDGLPIAVSAMLRGPWARVLERVYIRDGGRTETFAEFLEAADDLIWSVSPKVDQEQRQRLVRMLPTLLKRLREGMEIAAVEQQDRERFFAALVDCHAAAVKAGLRGESVTPLIRASLSTAETAPLFEKLINEEKARETELKNINRSGIARIQFTDTGVEIEEIVAGNINAANNAASKNESAEVADISTDTAAESFDLDQPMPVLKRGAWLEFIQAGGSKIRAKLTWVSPLKGVYLFTNPGASEALSITPDVLLTQFKRGQARLIAESSLMDRAVDSLVNSLAGASAAA